MQLWKKNAEMQDGNRIVSLPVGAHYSLEVQNRLRFMI